MSENSQIVFSAKALSSALGRSDVAVSAAASKQSPRARLDSDGGPSGRRSSTRP